MAVHHYDVQAAVLSRFKLRKTRIRSNHCAAITCNLLRQRAVTAAQVQDEFSGLRRPAVAKAVLPSQRQIERSSHSSPGSRLSIGSCADHAIISQLS